MQITNPKFNETPSDVNMSLEGSTYIPDKSQVAFDLLNKCISYKNATANIWDQCCHLQADGTSFWPYLLSDAKI